MIITENKVKVTYEMMEEANMTRYNQFGIPVDPTDPLKSLCWKEVGELQDSDFDKIENYFLNKNPGLIQVQPTDKRMFKVEFDLKFWAIMPTLNINLHSNQFEIEWLCFALYIGNRPNLNKEIPINQGQKEE